MQKGKILALVFLSWKGNRSKYPLLLPEKEDIYIYIHLSMRPVVPSISPYLRAYQTKFRRRISLQLSKTLFPKNPSQHAEITHHSPQTNPGYSRPLRQAMRHRCLCLEPPCSKNPQRNAAKCEKAKSLIPLASSERYDGNGHLGVGFR